MTGLFPASACRRRVGPWLWKGFFAWLIKGQPVHRSSYCVLLLTLTGVQGFLYALEGHRTWLNASNLTTDDQTSVISRG